MPFFKVIIGILPEDKEGAPVPSSAMYLTATNKEAIDAAFAKRDINLFSVDTIISTEEVSEKEVEENCNELHMTVAKRMVAGGYAQAFHIDSKRLC
jgi:hypothetical protein